MPRELNGIEFLTSQEWMRLGYPVFVTKALEGYNEQCAETKDRHDIITPAMFAAKSPKEQLEFTLEYEGIIGYTSYIWETVNRLQCLEKAKRLIGTAKASHPDWKRADYKLNLMVHDFSSVEAEQVLSWIMGDAS